MKKPSTTTILIIIAVGLYVFWIFMLGYLYQGFNPTIIEKTYCKSIGMEFQDQIWGDFDCVDEKGEIHTYDKNVLLKN